MSKHKNLVNPDYYKLRGREPQGGADTLAEVYRQLYAEARARERFAQSQPPPQPAIQAARRAAAAVRQPVEPPAAERVAAAPEQPAMVMAAGRSAPLPWDFTVPYAEPVAGKVPETAVREKRDDPRDAKQDLDIETRVGPGRQTSAKTGKQSSARKMARSRRYKAAPIPATNPVPGAFGRTGAGEIREEPEEE